MRRIFKEIESKDERLELNLYIVGEMAGEDEPRARSPRRRRSRVKLAYWPGCVSRGFTPELHGSMAKVAPLLDLELVELDRANCCGAGVIAEHNQELVDTLNARTFAMAQGVEGAAGMMNICSTCQGAQSECQERLDATATTASTSTPTSSPRASPTSGDGWWNKNFLWILVEEIGLDTLRERGRAPARGAADRALLRLLHRAARRSGSASTTTPSATTTSTW